MGISNMIFLIILINIFFFDVRAQERCTITGMLNLPCIMIYECRPLMNILEGTKPLSNSNLTLLRSHHCGFDDKKPTIPKVCCPNTPRVGLTSAIPDVTTGSIEITPSPLDDIKAQEKCTTGMSNLPCIMIYKCRPLMNILEGTRPISNSNLTLLRSHLCGFDDKKPMIPKVCCPNTSRVGSTNAVPDVSTTLIKITPNPSDDVKTQEKCRTSGMLNLPCIRIYECRPLMNILEGTKPLSNSNLTLLRSHHCGFDDKKPTIPKVCCPNTPRVVSTNAIPDVATTSSETTRNLPDDVKARESCTITGMLHLPCIIINDCPPLMNILQGTRPIPESSLAILRSHHCGFDDKTLKIPKVCCPNTLRIGLSSAIPDVASMSIEITPSPPDVTRNPNLRLLDHDICGPVTEPKIFGGNTTGVLDFPWMALIAYDVKGQKEFRCGGSIINKRYILTAAHCVTNLPPGFTVSGVRVGEHDHTTERDCDRDQDGFEIVCAERYQDFGVDSYQFHPEYTHFDLHNDIALIRVDADIDFRPINVKPICLPIGTAAELRQEKVTVTGWGATETNPSSSSVLLMVNLSPVTTEECAMVYKRSKPIWYKQLCAGGQTGKDSCSGDSGGPLQAPAIYYNNPRYVQYGIVSYGTRICGTKNHPGVYTRVSYYVDWILNHMTD